MAFSRELPTSFDEAIKLAAKILSTRHDLMTRGTIPAEAEQIVAAAYRMTGGKSLSRIELFTRIGDRYPEAAGEQVIVMASARAEGKLLQHLTGSQFFLEHEYEITPAVLVPRPETELLVTHALHALKAEGREPSLGLEVGLGSGCIAIELLSAFDGLRILASEVSSEAAELARKNASKILGATESALRLQILKPEGSLTVWEPFSSALGDRKADFLISNPPYLLAGSDEADVEVRTHEPGLALFAPQEDVLHFYRAFSQRAAEFIKPEGLVIVEIPHERAPLVRELFVGKGWETELFKDLNGRDRVVIARLPGGF